MTGMSDDAAVWVGLLDIDGQGSVVAPTGHAVTRYARARIMVRYHEAPLGYVTVPVAPAETLIPRAREAASVTLAAPLRAHIESDRLSQAEPGAQGWATAMACPRRFPVFGGPGLSIVICTRNRASGLSASLRALREISFSPLEILVVDNAPPNEDTRDATMVAAGEDGRVRYTCEPRAGISHARNHALSHARFNIVAFTDDDTVVDPGWADALAAGFTADAETMCVTGLVASAALDTGCERYFDSRYARGEAFEHRRYDLAEHRHPSRLYPFSAGIFGTGANFAVRRDAIVGLGGFDPLLGTGGPFLGGEDLDIFLRIILAGGRISYLPAALVWHKHRASVVALEQQIFAYGHGLGAYLAKHVHGGDLRARTLARSLLQVPSVSLRMREASRESQLRSRARRLVLSEAGGLAVGALRYRRVARQLAKRPARGSGDRISGSR
jgi:GT2 family glycosyltransferase